MDFKELTQKHLKLWQDIRKDMNEKLVAFQMENGVSTMPKWITFEIAKYPTNADEPYVIKVSDMGGTIYEQIAIKDEDKLKRYLETGVMVWAR